MVLTLLFYKLLYINNISDRFNRVISIIEKKLKKKRGETHSDLKKKCLLDFTQKAKFYYNFLSSSIEIYLYL